MNVSVQFEIRNSSYIHNMLFPFFLPIFVRKQLLWGSFRELFEIFVLLIELRFKTMVFYISKYVASQVLWFFRNNFCFSFLLAWKLLKTLITYFLHFTFVCSFIFIFTEFADWILKIWRAIGAGVRFWKVLKRARIVFLLS